MTIEALLKTLAMLGSICLLALIIELDFFIALPKFGAEHFGAPDDLKELVKKIPDKSKFSTAIGLVVMILSFLGVLAVFVWAVLDTYNTYSGFLMVFLRFLIILLGYKIFDIVVFDWLLMTKIRFPEKMYPETKGAKGYESFGFNAKSQTIKIFVFLALSAVIALVYYFICR